MQIQSESYGHAAILILEGELTEDSLGVFSQAVDHQLDNTDVVDLVLNMQKTPFVDSASLEYLLDIQERLNERLGRVKFVKVDEYLRKILEITRLDSVFEAFDDVPSAVKVMQG